MSSYFHALAVDYDGTLARGPRPTSEVLNAVAIVRDNGYKVVLVTGRILSELRADFPDVDQHFDCIVGENGAVVSSRHGTRLLGPPVDSALEYDLRTQGIPVRRGEVLLATNSIHDEFVTSAIDRLGFECQIVRNRAALMVLPAGVTKGSGLNEALGDLGISPHNTVGIGDAENDHSLLDACEIGVAVGDAVPSLKARADLVLGGVDGEAVDAFLVGPFLGGLTGLQSRRRTIALGTYDDGTMTTLPASRISIAINGASGTGKSFLAGLIAEQLIQMNYAICILDLEGDHLAIGGLHGAVALGGREPLPPPAQVDRVIRQGFSSVVIDLSLQTPDVKRRYALAILEQLRLTRSTVGLPHWIIVDEAHVPIAGGLRHWWRDSDESGICVITYRPDLLAPELEQYADFVITARGPSGEPAIPRRRRPRTRLHSRRAAHRAREALAQVHRRPAAHRAAVLFPGPSRPNRTQCGQPARVPRRGPPRVGRDASSPRLARRFFAMAGERVPCAVDREGGAGHGGRSGTGHDGHRCGAPARSATPRTRRQIQHAAIRCAAGIR